MTAHHPTLSPWRFLARAGLLLLLLVAMLLAAALLFVRLVCLSCQEAPLPPAQADAEPPLAARLRQDVNALCAHPRYGDEQTRQKTIHYITQRLENAGWQVRHTAFCVPADPEAEEESSRPTPREQHWNICATLPAAGNSKAPRYIIGAHYDACDTGTHNPGADDNASACAALLALADMLAPQPGATPRPPGSPVPELVFYACEEPPWFDTDWMGSAQHARRCTTGNTLGMICLEMLGYYCDSPCAQPELVPGLQHLLPPRGNFIALVGDLRARPLARRAQEYLQRGMPALRLNVPLAQETELFFSDHRNYARRGIPAIMVTDTAMLRNPHYHEATDTPDTLDYHRLARVTLNLAHFLRALLSERP